MKVIITDAEFQANSQQLANIITNSTAMTLNGIDCIYGECTVIGAQTIAQVANVDSFVVEGVLLPKEVVVG